MSLAASIIRAGYGFLGDQPALRRMLLTTPVARDLAWRFVAGETLDTGLSAVRRLNAMDIKGTLSLLGAHVMSMDEAEEATKTAIEALHRIHTDCLDSNVSIKLTQIGLDIDESLCRSQLRRVLERASQLGIFVRIDMEESRYVERTLSIFDEMLRFCGPKTVGVVIQSYLKNRRNDLKQILDKGASIRLVKGGYWESREVVYRARTDIDRVFREDIDLMLSRPGHPAVASHDSRSIEHAQAVATAIGRERREYELQMLYGVREDLQGALIRGGHTLRCYVPYGKSCSRYVLGCVRRAPREWLDRRRDHSRTESISMTAHTTSSDSAPNLPKKGEL